MASKKPASDSYKEYPNQNYIELKFNTKSYDSIGADEAHTRYKSNNALMGQIFSIENQEKTLERINSDETQEQQDITGLLKNVCEELADTEKHYSKKVKSMSDDCKDFHKDIHKLRITGVTGTKDKDSTNDYLSQVMADLEDQQEIPHPFVCKQSPFYNNFSQEMWMFMENPTEKDRPFTGRTEEERLISL